jgi:hypothetical protein
MALSPWRWLLAFAPLTLSGAVTVPALAALLARIPLHGPRQSLEQKRTLSYGQDVTITATPRSELGPSRPRRRGPVGF